MIFTAILDKGLDLDHPLKAVELDHLLQDHDANDESDSPRRAAEPIRRRADDELLTAQELADYLKIPLRQEGTGVRGLRIGKHLRFRRSDVEMWLESKQDPI